MGYLDRAVFVPCLLDISEDADTSQPVAINGYEIIGVITPDTLDGGTNDIDSIEIDPGNGTFYAPLGEDGAAIDIQMDNIGTDEYLTLAPITVMRQKLVGARARLQFSEAEDADRTFYLVLVALPGSAD
ncbi:MAG: hypothetical protein IIC90_08585 [Chloroflexi bacterium]|nr:hypothetical protein [Chloroflexota bacterium]